MKYDYDTLVLLRENVKLSLSEYIKVRELRVLALEYQDCINRIEKCKLGVDFSNAFQLEFDFRFDRWKKKVTNRWIEKGSENNLEEFALDELNKQNEKKHVLKK